MLYALQFTSRPPMSAVTKIGLLVSVAANRMRWRDKTQLYWYSAKIYLGMTFLCTTMPCRRVVAWSACADLPLSQLERIAPPRELLVLHVERPQYPRACTRAATGGESTRVAGTVFAARCASRARARHAIRALIAPSSLSRVNGPRRLRGTSRPGQRAEHGLLQECGAMPDPRERF